MQPNNYQKSGISLSMLGWALNEEENIVAYIERAQRFLEKHAADYELIIIDDGSTDRTWEIAQSCQESRPWLRLYQNDGTRGSGYNTKRALSLAEKNHVFWQTVDWAYDITLLGENFHLLMEYDVLQGVRTDSLSLTRLFSARSDTPLKAFISITNYLLVRLLFRLPLHDYQNVTVYPRQLIQSVKLETESAFTNPECLLKTWWRGVTIKEIPVSFIKRQVGEAKGTRLKFVIASVKDVFFWWLQWIILGKRPDRKRGHVVYWSEEREKLPGEKVKQDLQNLDFG